MKRIHSLSTYGFMLILITALTGCNLAELEGEVLFSLGGIHPAKGRCSYDATHPYADQHYTHCVLTDTYLWSATVPETIDYQNYQDAAELLDALKLSELDHFSFITSADKANQYYQQGVALADPGVRVIVVLGGENSFLWVYRSYIGSAGYLAGIRRGHRIHSINDVTVYQMWQNVQNNNSSWYEEFGFKIDSPNTVVYSDELSETHTIEVTLTDFEIQTVEADKLVTLDSGEQGLYFSFNGFIEPAKEDLLDLFDAYNDSDINFAIVDLRSNGGGISYISNLLVSVLIGKALRDEEGIFKQNIYNEKYSYFNSQTHYFPSSQLPERVAQSDLGLQKIVFLTDNQTCSASELVINAFNTLKHEFDIAVIGKASCGKPYGMFPKVFGDKAIYAVEYKLANSEGFGDYIHGIDVDCYADALMTTYDWGDLRDPVLSNAMQWLNTGRCLDETASDGEQLPQLVFLPDFAI